MELVLKILAFACVFVLWQMMSPIQDNHKED